MSHSPPGNIVPHWINGCAAEASSGRTFEVLNPLDDHSIATAALGNEADLDCAAEAAGAAFREFRDTSVKAREGWLISAADRLENDAESFVELLIDQTGSAISKARREVATAVGVLRAAAGSVRRISGQTMPSDVPQRWSLSFREPLGVVAAITPFNV